MKSADVRIESKALAATRSTDEAGEWRGELLRELPREWRGVATGDSCSESRAASRFVGVYP
jgi:hypothetical protein